LAISDYGNNKVNFATHKDFDLDYKEETILKTETATKPAFLNYLRPLITDYGVHPIYNSKGEACEQIVNIPDTILSSKEILEYLNKYTILPQETPPWQEIIYKLRCYSETLTNEYYEKIGYKLPNQNDWLRSEDDIDIHYFVTAPKISEKKRGFIFTLPKPNRAHRKWVILSEYYDYKKNGWVDPESDSIEKREEKRVELIDKEKPINQYDIEKAKEQFFKKGGKVKKLDEKPLEFDWKSLKIHPLAETIPPASETEKESLRKDIVLNGVYETIKLYEGMVLDGRTRQGICVEEGIKPTYEAWKKGVSPELYVEALNLKRRHLSSSQLAAYGVKNMLPRYEKEAEKRRKLSNAEKIQHTDKYRAGERVADILEINSKYIYDAKKILEKSSDVFNKIFTGDLTISKAKHQIKLSTQKSKPRKKTHKFESEFRKVLQKIVDYTGNEKLNVLHDISVIYLKWNKRNGKKLLKQLDNLKSDYSNVFRKKPKLELFTSKNLNTDELLEM
jgi:hypothetical protein